VAVCESCADTSTCVLLKENWRCFSGKPLRLYTCCSLRGRSESKHGTLPADISHTRDHNTAIFADRYFVAHHFDWLSISISVCSCFATAQGQLQYLSLQRFEKHDRERGQRKYEMAAKIMHPNVLTVYSWCETLSQVSRGFGVADLLFVVVEVQFLFTRTVRSSIRISEQEGEQSSYFLC
jgi:hypothetical protein